MKLNEDKYKFNEKLLQNYETVIPLTSFQPFLSSYHQAKSAQEQTTSHTQEKNIFFLMMMKNTFLILNFVNVHALQSFLMSLFKHTEKKKEDFLEKDEEVEESSRV
jgi:hypothetical protein